MVHQQLPVCGTGTAGAAGAAGAAWACRCMLAAVHACPAGINAHLRAEQQLLACPAARLLNPGPPCPRMPPPPTCFLRTKVHRNWLPHHHGGCRLHDQRWRRSRAKQAAHLPHLPGGRVGWVCAGCRHVKRSGLWKLAAGQLTQRLMGGLALAPCACRASPPASRCRARHAGAASAAGGRGGAGRAAVTHAS